MRERVDELRNEVLSLQKRGIQYNILKRDVESNRNIYNGLLQRFKEVDVAGGVGTNNVFIVDRALAPAAPTEPSLPRALLMSFALGLAAGLGIAYLLDQLDDRVRAPEDIEQLSGLSTLGIIPRIGSLEQFADDLRDPGSSVSEAYRSLATALQFSTEGGLPKSIAVTSSGPAEGKSSTAVALARHFATMGMKVLLIDADMRKPSLHEKLNQENSVGLSNYLTGSVSPPDAIQKTDIPRLAFMPSGPLPPNAADLLGGTRIFSLISIGLEVFDLIVVDSPPMLGLADAQLLSGATSATVFVVGAGGHRKGMITSALRRLHLARANILGVVLTKFDSKAVGYGYGYGNGSEAYTYGKPAIAKSTEPAKKPQADTSAVA
jgi:capsular exopolysaccharide synthesis family protein